MVKIGERTLRKNELQKPYLIAEAGVNHEGKIETAKQMIEEVARAKGDSIKFQVYKASTLAAKNSPAYWDTNREPIISQYELFSKYDKFWKREIEELADYANFYKIDFLATPFDKKSADFLEPIVPMFKIASADITNKPLIKQIAKKKKPILLSTGAATMSEIWQSLEWIVEEGNKDVILLHCILNYPTNYMNANLGMIRYMDNNFADYLIGYSDHTMADKINEVIIGAWLLGAKVIEKHYTWDKDLPGNDHYHSMDYNDLKRLVDTIEFMLSLVGTSGKNYIESELISRKQARRSLVAKKNIPAGKVIEEEDITWKRPGVGIPTTMIDNVVGGTALTDINEDTVLKFEMVKLTSNKL